MPTTLLQAGASIETLSKKELQEALAEAQATNRARLSGRKIMKFRSVSAAPVSNALTIGGADHNQGTILGPTQGFTWSLRLFVIVGLTASSSAPDTMNIYKSGTGDLMWQLNGNVFAQTWGLGEMPLFGGESMFIQNSGNLAATGNIYFHGWAIEVPAEKQGDLL